MIKNNKSDFEQDNMFNLDNLIPNNSEVMMISQVEIIYIAKPVI